MTDGDLDTLAAERVMGWHPWHPWDPWEGLDRQAPLFARWGDGVTLYRSRGELSCDSGRDWSPSTSIADAWEIVGKVSAFDKDREHPWLCFVISHAQPGQVGCRVVPCPPGHSIWCDGERPIAESVASAAPRAICIAALRAVGVEAGGS